MNDESLPFHMRLAYRQDRVILAARHVSANIYEGTNATGRKWAEDEEELRLAIVELDRLLASQDAGLTAENIASTMSDLRERGLAGTLDDII